MWYLKEKDNFTKSEFLKHILFPFERTSECEELTRPQRAPEISEAVLLANALLLLFFNEASGIVTLPEVQNKQMAALEQVPDSQPKHLVCYILHCENTTASRAIMCYETTH